jgi:hypothetical protein
MKMFGLKTVLAAGAIALLGGQAGASTIVCKDYPTADVDRYLELVWSGGVSVSCLDAGTDWNESDFPESSLGYDYDVGTATSSENTLGSILTNVVGSLWGGNEGSFRFTDPGTYDSYALLFKFGKNTQEAWGWFLMEVAFNGETFFDLAWLSIIQDVTGSCPDQEGVFDDQCTSTKWALSHVSIYGKDQTTTVPLPAGGLLLLTALGGMALVRRRKMVAA